MKVKKLAMLGLVGAMSLTAVACNKDDKQKQEIAKTVDEEKQEGKTEEKKVEKLEAKYDSVKKFITDKGVDEITLDDFEHIEHEDIGSGFFCYKYKLDDGFLLLSTVNDEKHPFSVMLINKEGEEISLKNDYTALERIENKDEDNKDIEKENKETEDNNNKQAEEDTSKYKELVESTIEDFPGFEGKYIIKDAAIVKATEEADKLTLLLSYAENRYNYKDKVFENTGGMITPLKLEYVKDGDNWKLEKKTEAEDGEKYFPSLVKMADGDEDLAKKLMENNANGRHSEWMEKLAKKAQEDGITDFEVELNDIPGYPEDTSLFIEDAPNKPANTVEIVNKEEYEKLKKTKKDGFKSIEGLLYDKNTKILLKTIVEVPDEEN